MATIDLDLMSTFSTVAELGSFSAAALRLKRPKSSVSRSIAALEADLGVRLLHRTTRRVELTTAGAALHQRIAQPLGALLQATEDLPERDTEPAGLLRITTLNDLGSVFLAEVAARFAMRYPRIELELMLTERIVDLVAERVDVALRVSTKPLGDSSLIARRIGRVEMQLYAAPSYLARRSTPRHPRELDAHDWVALTNTRPLAIGRSGEAITLPSHAHIRCNEGTVARSAIRAGGGVGVLPSLLAEEDVKRGLLVRVLPRYKLTRGHLWFVYPSGRQVPRKVSVFRDFVIEALKSHPLLAL